VDVKFSVTSITTHAINGKNCISVDVFITTYRPNSTNVNGMVINTSKTQEMVVYFGKHLCVDDMPLIYINGRHIKRVVSFKLLGVIISSDLGCTSRYCLHLLFSY